MTSRDVGLPWYVIFQPYSLEKELQTDFDGMRHWKSLQWDCSIWVRILEDFQGQNSSGDNNHSTQTRLHQSSPRPAVQPELIVTSRCKLIRTAGIIPKTESELFV